MCVMDLGTIDVVMQGPVELLKIYIGSRRL